MGFKVINKLWLILRGQLLRRLSLAKIFGLLNWNLIKRFLIKWGNYYVVNVSHLDYLIFRAYLGMKITDLLQIENMDTLCC